ncbi:unnamed protein product [Linum trigynum]|uniref:Uncharacterized protein n=1 Tax=Linum trigynum TaxID=586398 RepID=A0AAV2FSG5_9ROSI
MEVLYIGVEYGRLPPCCHSCGIFGHDFSKPTRPTKRIWRKKKIHVEKVQIGMEEESSLQDVSNSEQQLEFAESVTPSALLTQEDFSKVINGAKQPQVWKTTEMVSHSNSFEILCSKEVQLQFPPLRREGLRSQKGANKAPPPSK